MTDGITTRKLVRQEWKPLGGHRIVRFVAMPGSNTIPDMEWRTDLAGKGEVVNEVVGYAEMESGLTFPAIEEFGEFCARVRDEARLVSWRTDWAERAAEAYTAESEATADAETGEEGEEEETPEPEPEPSEPSESDADGEEYVVFADGIGDRIERAYDESEEPYQLPSDAKPEDVREGVRYKAFVNNIETYGVFVVLPNTVGNYEDVNGLIHKSKMGMHHPTDYEEGDSCIVEALEVKDNGDIAFELIDANPSGVTNDSLFPELEDQYDA